nr:cell division control protein 45 [Cryptomonas sp.]
MIVDFSEDNIIENILYEETRSNLRGELSLVFFSRIDLDSILICKFLSEILESKFKLHMLFPIFHQSDVNIFCKKFKKERFRYYIFIFINFGRNCNLRKFCHINSVFIKKIFVIDRQKQIHIENVISSSIIIFMNGINLLGNTLKILPEIRFLSDKNILDKISPIFKLGNILNTIYESNSKMNNNTWLDLIYISNLHIIGLIKNKIFETILSLTCKKFDIYSQMKKRNHLQYTNTSVLRKIRDFPIFLLRHSSLVDALVRTPSFSIKLRLWKYSGIFRLSHLCLRIGISFEEIKKPWFQVKNRTRFNFRKNIIKEGKYFGVEILKFYSFVKIYSSFTYNCNKEYKEVSISDFIYAINSMFDVIINEKICPINRKIFWNVYDCFFNLETIEKGIKKAKETQDFVNKISRIIIFKKTYIKESTIRYVFLKNSKNIPVTYNTLKNLALYLISAFNQKYHKDKAFFIVFHLEDKSLIIGSFCNIEICKIIKERLNLREIFINRSVDVNSTRIICLIFKKNEELQLFRNMAEYLR